MSIRIVNRIPLKYARHMTEEEIRSEQMMVELAQKNGQHFAKLYDKYFEAIFYFIYRRTDDEELTADLTSQTFYLALEKIRKYEFRGLPFSAWLYRIASNEINKHYRKSKSKRIFSLEETRIKEVMEESGEGPDDLKLNILIKTMNELPTEVIEILELRYFEEKSFKEISFILDISESGAKMRVYRTLQKLKEVMSKELDNSRDGQA